MNKVATHPKDLMKLTGKCERYCRQLYKHIREEYNKKPHQLLTPRECYEYLGITLDDLNNDLVKK